MANDNVIYLDAGRSDVAKAMDSLNEQYRKGNIKAMLLTMWTEDGHMYFTAVGTQDSAGAVMETIGAMEHHKSFVMNAYNNALIAHAEAIARQGDDESTNNDPGQPA